ncbi:MAG: HDOD domain-containing protein [Gammaproteobacteria bacterium]|nr:HDOD domain-containing protein [Gammaproteobacteria bacterium]
MSLTDESSINAVLQQLNHLAGIDAGLLERFAREAEIHVARPGTRLLELGSTNPQQLLLIQGELELTAGDGARHRVRHGDNAAAGPVSRLRPSRYRVVAHSRVRYMLVDQAMLDAYQTNNTTLVVEESYSVSEPNELLDDSASHPLIFDVFNDINLGRLVVPSCSDVAVRVGRALRRHADDLERFTEILTVCPALTLKTMRAARATDEAGRTPRNVREALVRLGVDQSYALSVNCVLRETLRSCSPTVSKRMTLWWRHSMRTAAIARALARSSERFDPHLAALIGLLHGIAEPAMLAYADRHEDLADEAALDNLLRNNRTELGRILLAMWSMPRAIVEATANSDNWGYDHNGDADYTDILLVALWHATLATNTRPRIPPAADIPAFRRLGLDSPGSELGMRVVAAGGSAVERAEALLDE